MRFEIVAAFSLNQLSAPIITSHICSMSGPKTRRFSPSVARCTNSPTVRTVGALICFSADGGSSARSAFESTVAFATALCVTVIDWRTPTTAAKTSGMTMTKTLSTMMPPEAISRVIHDKRFNKTLTKGSHR